MKQALLHIENKENYEPKIFVKDVLGTPYKVSFSFICFF